MKIRTGLLKHLTSRKVRRLLIAGVTLGLALSNVIPLFRVFAVENGGDYAEVFMRGATGASTEGGITFTYDGGTVAVSGATDPVVELDNNWNYGDHTGPLYKFYTKSSSLTFTPTADGNNPVRVFAGADGQNNEVTLTNGQYSMEGLVNKGNSGPTYDIEFQFGGNGGAPQPQPGNSIATLDYTYSGVGGLDFRLNGSLADMGGANFDDQNHAVIEARYDKQDTDTTIDFTFETLWINVMDSLVVNGVDYSANLPATTEQLATAYDGHQHVAVTLAIPVANNDTYVITSHTHEAEGEEIFMGNFLWDNDTSKLDTLSANDVRRDDIIGHGSFEFVKATYRDTTYNSLTELNNAGGVFSFEQDPAGDGSATFPVGTELTVRLLPEAGYQLTSFGINGGAFEPQANVGEYTFTVLPGNGHFAANFEAIDNAVTAEAEAVESGSIELGDDELDYGTAILEVEEADLDEADIAGFENAAGDYNISTYLDISLYQVTYKGVNSAKGAWKEQIDELENEATITLQLEDGVDGNEIVIIHQMHDGTYEIIPTIYDPAANTITFKTSSFSNYVIATSSSVEKKTDEAGAETSPNTGIMTTDGGSVRLVVSGLAVAVALAAVLGLRRVYSKRK